MTSSVTPLRAAASRTRWTAGWIGASGTGRSLASGHEGRIRRGSIAGMDALILADGDARPAPSSTPPGRAGTSAIGLVVAADGGARLAGPLGVAIDRWVGDGDSLGRDRDRRARGGGRPDRADAAATRTNRTPSWRSRRRSGSGADGVVVVGGARRPADRSRARQHRPAGHAGPRRPARDPARRAVAGIAHPRPGRRRRGGRRARSRAAPATRSRCCRWAPASRA